MHGVGNLDCRGEPVSYCSTWYLLVGVLSKYRYKGTGATVRYQGTRYRIWKMADIKCILPEGPLKHVWYLVKIKLNIWVTGPCRYVHHSWLSWKEIECINDELLPFTYHQIATKQTSDYQPM